MTLRSALAFVVLALSSPLASAQLEVGACAVGECIWLDESGHVMRCRTNGLAFLFAGEDRHVFYCAAGSTVELSTLGGSGATGWTALP